MKSIQIVRAATVALAFAGIQAGTVQAAEADPAAQAAAAIEQAEAARKKADSVGGEWRDTAKLIKQAQAAAKEGNHAEAIKLANTAYREGELGHQQALSQKGADFPAYLK